MDFRFIQFCEDILSKVIADFRDKQAVFIFPTMASKKRSLLLYQDQLDFNGSLFFTMDEWKDEIFPAEFPILKEEKRHLALYQSLNNVDRNKYNINSFPGFIEFANRFFKFWEELNEECVEDEILLKTFSQNSLSLGWQKDTIRDFITIKKKYKNYLDEWHYSDNIFLRLPSNINLAHFDYFDHFIVVNQYYYTRLEKILIQKLTEKIHIYYQIPEKLIDKKNLVPVKEIEISDLSEFQTKKVEIYQSPDETSMVLTLMNKLDDIRPDIIVDFRFNNKYYSRFFSPLSFESSNTDSISNSSIFRLIKALTEFIASSQQVKPGSKILYQLQYFLNLLLTEEFILLFDPSQTLNKSEVESTLDYIYELIDGDYKYIDLSGELLAIKPPGEEARVLLKSAFSLLESIINQSTSLPEFCDLFLDDGLLSPKFYLQDKEKCCSNLCSTFYQALAVFKSLENLKFPIHWKELFPIKPNSFSNKSSYYFKLFCNHLNLKEFNWNITESRGRYKVSSLQNTRDLCFNKVAILSLTEGVLPASPRPSFLLTENQRKLLGLKTYEDIRAREKYYFSRLILQSKSSYLFTCSQPEKNIEISSYLEELRISFPEECINTTEYMEFPLISVYKDFIKPSDSLEISEKPIAVDDNFFVIPYEQNTDFVDKELILSYYKWQDLKRNPFLYYLKHLCKIEPRTTTVTQDFSDKMIGNLAHAVFQKIIDKIDRINRDVKYQVNIAEIEENLIDNALDDVINDRNFIYRKPPEFSELYFEHIFKPVLKEGIIQFFKLLPSKILKNSCNDLKLYPERFKTSKTRFLLEINEPEILRISLKGRADLRIERDEKKFIIDYKTGSSRQKKNFLEQLLFYELIYYLPDSLKIDSSIESFLYFIEEQVLYDFAAAKTDKESLLNKFQFELKNKIQQILKLGFRISTKHDPYDIVEITRKDLFVSRKIK